MSRNNLHIISLCIGLIVCGLFVNRFTKNNINFENFAMGRNTTSYFPVKEGIPIHFDRLSIELNNYLKNDRNLNKPTILILGNSQTHGINQMGENDINYPEILYDSLKMNVFAFSIPNANIQEMYLAHEYLREYLDIKMLILPAFFDDMREDGIREIFFEEVISQNFQIDGEAIINRKINEEIEKFVDLNVVDSTKLKRISLQERSENVLNEFMDGKSVAWKNRDKLRGTVFTKLYVTRNSLLGINAQSKRRMIPARYSNNLLALKQLVQKAEKENVKTLVYIPPIRNDVEIPYSIDEYLKFKNEINTFIEPLENVKFKNFEEIVPGEFWGLKNGSNLSGKKELDFMHFTGEGHRILANKLINEIHQLDDL